MNNKTFIVVRPSYERLTNICFYWSQKIIDAAQTKGMNVVDLARDKANRKELSGRLKKLQPVLVVINGHGNEFEVVGQEEVELLNLQNAGLLKGSVVYSRACESAVVLGRVAVNRGAAAFIGYLRPFWLPHDTEKTTRPLDDKVAQLFLEPSNHVAISLIKGHTAGEASERSKEMSKKTMLSLMTSTATSEDSMYAQILWANSQSQICWGDSGAKL